MKDNTVNKKIVSEKTDSKFFIEQMFSDHKKLRFYKKNHETLFFIIIKKRLCLL